MGNLVINGVSYNENYFEKVDLDNGRIGLKAKNGVIIDFKKTTNYENASVKYDETTRQVTIDGFRNNEKYATNSVNITGTDNDDIVVVENSTLNNVNLGEGNDNLILNNSTVKDGNIFSKAINYLKSIINGTNIHSHNITAGDSESIHNKYYTYGNAENDTIYFENITVQNDTIFNNKCIFEVVPESNMDTITAYVKKAYIHTDN